MSPTPDDGFILVYCPASGASSVTHPTHGEHTFVTSTTLGSAYAKAVRAGYAPARWSHPRRMQTTLPLDQAEHWRGMMERGQL